MSYAKLEDVRQREKKYGADLPEGLPAEMALEFRQNFQKVFGFVPEDRYVALLAIADGLDVNSFHIYSSGHSASRIESVFSANKTWRNKGEPDDLVFLAESGQDLFVVRDGKNTLLDRYSGDEIQVFDSFEQMADYIIDRMLS